ncbi:hypothetical protein TNCV_4128701 [Trichonephila clavipes]|nr:hypothetical protein TNCV_4128701 [Trichonephila clavipes]
MRSGYPSKTQPARLCGLDVLTRFCFWNSRTKNSSPWGFRIIFQRNRSTCWTKPSDCDVDLSLMDVEETTGRRDRSHPPRCPTVREERWIARIEVMDRTATRTRAQQIQSAAHHLVSASTI